MDVLLLSRIQFAFNIGFHYLFPPLSIGLGVVLVIAEGMYLKTKKSIYEELTKFWVKIFALTFALGVATGVVQVFSFGNNWARYSRFVGDVFGSALAAEGVFAFTLEAGFLGVLLFGWNKVKPRIHFLSTILVCLGAHFSAIWIVVANSWMQTPAGFKIVGEGVHRRAEVTDFWQMVFNPSFLDRITHVLIGCWMTGGFMVIAISAYYFLKKRHLQFAKYSMYIGLSVATIATFLQAVSGDSTGRGVARNQPEKLAAIEGIFETTESTPMGVLGYVDMKERKVKGLTIPGLLSFLVYRNFKTPVTGLNAFDSNDWPNVGVVFQTYHLMLWMWGLMLITVLWGLWKRKRLEKSKWLLRLMVVSPFFPVIANQAGWFTAEMGRQPWIVYHVMRTTQGFSKNLSVAQVIGSLSMFFVLYGSILTLFFYLLNRKLQHGPSLKEEKEVDGVYADPYSATNGGKECQHYK